MDDDFGVYAVLGLNNPPQRLLCVIGSSRTSVAVPPKARQVVLFTNGPWGERICVNAELNDADRVPITIGKLTPYNKCLSWEKWEEETWTDGVTLNISLVGGDLCTTAPSAVPGVKGKKKRVRTEAEEEEALWRMGEEENICPNGSPEKGMPQRKIRGHAKEGHKPFAVGGNNAKGTANAVEDVQGNVGKRPLQNAKRKSGSTKMITQTAPLVNPSARWGQTLCPIDDQTAILTGGQGVGMKFCKDPIWKLCTEDMSWVAAETLAEGPTPEARIGHTVTYDPDSRRIFVFGGSKKTKWFNDVHILDTQSWKWSLVEAQGEVPPLAYHSCSLFRGELFVLGGVFPCPSPEPDGCSQSLYIFDPHLSIWYQPIVTGDTPPPRSGHSACVMQERKIYVFGGWDTPVCYNDMYMLDLGLMEFSVVKTAGKAPSPRCWHGSAVISDTKFLIHGGYNGHNALSDTFIFDIDSNSWTELCHPQLSLPRAGHSITTMDTTRRHCHNCSREEEEGVGEEAKGCVTRTLIMFGGGDNEGKFYSDLTTIEVEELLDRI